MTRESRIVLVIGLLAALGVTSLLLIADRYRRLVPPPAGAPPAVEHHADDELRRAAGAELVRGFLAVRGAVTAVVRGNREQLDAALDPAAKPSGAEDRAYRRVAAAVGDRKRVVLERIGMSTAEYDRMRVAFLEWRAGSQELDPVLRREFDAARKQLERLDLGPFEVLDASTP